jgi:protein TonB
VPLREGRAQVGERLVAMLFLAALLHAIVILGLTFAAGGIGGGATPQLDVLLVTNEVPEAQSNERATYLAQRTQLGSGNTDQPAPAASPASRGAPEREQQAGQGDSSDSAAASRAQPVLASSGSSSDVRYLGEEQSSASSEPLPEMIGDLPGDPRSGQGEQLELLLRGKSDAEHWVTPDTRASALAPYLAAWKRKVERVGNLNLPSAVRNAGLSGSPVVEVDIAANGRLREATVRRSSGSGALDQAALTILKLASPFEPFPADVAASYSQLRFAYQWDFVAGALQSGAVTVSSDTPSRP